MGFLETVLVSDKGPMYGQDGTRTYTQVWNCRTDEEASWQQVCNEIGIVQFQTPHPRDPFALATEVDCDQHEDDDNYWLCTYKFSTKLNELAQASLAAGGGGAAPGGAEHNPDDPLSWAPKVRWSTKMFKRLRYRDNDGTLYANAAGELLELPSKEKPRLVLSVQRNVPDFNVETLNNMVGAVNESVCIGYEARRIKCERLTAEPQRDKQFYWKLDGEFTIGSTVDVDRSIWPDVPTDGWWFDKRLNAGYSYYDPDEDRLRNIFIDGQRPARPQLLDATGAFRLDVNAGDVPNFLYFRELNDADFNATGIFNP